jgi:hypothetical protein
MFKRKAKEKKRIRRSTITENPGKPAPEEPIQRRGFPGLSGGYFTHKNQFSLNKATSGRSGGPLQSRGIYRALTDETGEPGKVGASRKSGIPPHPHPP